LVEKGVRYRFTLIERHSTGTKIVKFVITGGAGYIGSVAVAHLLADGHDVAVYDRLLYGGESLLAYLSHPRFSLTIGDVRDTERLTSAIEGAGAVVHLAAIVGEPACSIDDAASWSINVDGSLSALGAARAAGVPRFLFVSTCSNYGLAEPNVTADESSPLKPLSRYAEAKVACEQAMLEPGTGMATTVLRFGTICGVSARMRFDLLVSEMARSAVSGETIVLYTPEAWRPFLHVRDAARAIATWAATPAEQVSRRVFNVVGENYQKRGLADLVRRHFPATPIAITDRAPDLRDYRVSGRLIEEVLGFRTVKTVEDAFLETADAVRGGLFRNASDPAHSALPPNPAVLREFMSTAVAP
jgi:nucleoside-diphosphate-sugar epimerase